MKDISANSSINNKNNSNFLFLKNYNNSATVLSPNSYKSNQNTTNMIYSQEGGVSSNQNPNILKQRQPPFSNIPN